MINDIYTAGILSGIIANIPINLIDYILYRLNINKVFVWHIAASAFVERKDIKTTPGVIIGAVDDYIMAGCKGLVVILLLKLTSVDYYIFKGLTAGLFFWIVFFGSILRLKIPRIEPVEPVTNLVHMAWHLLLGVLIALLIVHWDMLAY